MTTPTEPDPNLAAELRGDAGASWAEEAAEDERMTELLRRRRLELSQVVRDAAHRGDRVTVAVGGQSHTGEIVEAGPDHAVVAGRGRKAVVRYEVGRWTIAGPSETRSARGVTTSMGFFATLRALEADGEAATFLLKGNDSIVGRIAVVAVDHIEIVDADESRTVVPIGLVLGFVRSTDPH